MATPAVPVPRAVNPPARPQAALVGLLLLVVLATVGWMPVLTVMFRIWMDDPNMSHGVVVPFACAALVWWRRPLLQGADRAPDGRGVGLILLAVVVHQVATPGSWLYLMRVSYLLALAGAVICTFGPRVLRRHAFAVALLLFAVPPPTFLYEKLTMPLQLTASSLAAAGLELSGYSVLRTGNILHMPHQTLSVVEACSGIRSLFTLTFFTLCYGYLLERRIWLRAVLVAATVPITVAANALRVVFTGIGGEYNHALAEGNLHSVSGWLAFVLALICMTGVHSAMRAWTRKSA